MTLKEFCREKNLRYADALVFMFCLKHQDEGTMEVFMDRFFDDETDKFRMCLTKLEDGVLVPVEFDDESGEIQTGSTKDFHVFVDLLKKSGMSSTGYAMSNTDYVIFKPNDASLKDAFSMLRKNTSYTMKAIVNQIVKFYTSEAKFKPSLDKYLKSGIIADL